MPIWKVIRSYSGRERKHNIKSGGGYARIATLIKHIKAEKNNQVLVLDNGDTIHGTFAAVNSKGKAMLPVLNKVGIEGMTAHWEFGYGPERFMKITEELNYPMLAINAYDEKVMSCFLIPI